MIPPRFAGSASSFCAHALALLVGVAACASPSSGGPSSSSSSGDASSSAGTGSSSGAPSGSSAAHSGTSAPHSSSAAHSGTNAASSVGASSSAAPGSSSAQGVTSSSSAVASSSNSAGTTTPQRGAHALGYYRLEGHSGALSTPTMDTQASGSTIIVSVGRGDISAFARPTDNKGNTAYTPLGTAHPYTLWSSSGTALCAGTLITGGNGHVVSTTTPPGDELTLAAVEVRNASQVVDMQWNEVLEGNPLTSLDVTTTGAATLVAFWWGDAGVDMDKTAVPDNGFTVVDSILLSGALVQCAVATRDVAAAGTYHVTWTSTPSQGAQLWLVAVQ